jgi:hypothetical protein
VLSSRDAGGDLRGPDHVVLGNPEGDVTLVEMFDYNCGYCRSVSSRTWRPCSPRIPTSGSSSRNSRSCRRTPIDAARVAVLVAQAGADYWQYPRASCSPVAARSPWMRRSPPRRSSASSRSPRTRDGTAPRSPPCSPELTRSPARSAFPARPPTSSATRSSPACRRARRLAPAHRQHARLRQDNLRGRRRRSGG